MAKIQSTRSKSGGLGLNGRDESSSCKQRLSNKQLKSNPKTKT